MTTPDQRARWKAIALLRRQPGAIAQHRKAVAKQAAENKRLQNTIMRQLQLTLPAGLEKWFAESGSVMLEGLFQHGMCSSKFYRGEGGNYGYGPTMDDLCIFEQQLFGLNVSWNKIVRVTTRWDAEYRFEVIFEAME